ncbi:MAG: NAD(P)/FAD-dependent oxidoreductase [Chitinophagales bacterium]|nr:NAD(P)/FAD-dependent oxidoreductase [Chitinophagales bacterium]
MSADKKTLIVIGGGAAGFFCAVNAARLQPALQVIIVEKTGKVLQKVKVSGGGRCNVTHALFEIPELSRRYPRGQSFLKKSLHWFSPKDTLSWFAERGVRIQQETDGRMFPNTNSSQTIIDCLLREANQYGVELLLNCDVQEISRHEAKFVLITAGNRILKADYLCIATGGYPKAAQFDWLTATGHTITPPVPSLFTFNMPKHPITALMGVSVANASVKILGTKLQETGPVLITHWGMSGPAVLRLSAWGARELADKQYQFTAMVNWLPEYHEQSLKEAFTDLRQTQAAQKIHGKNPFGLPNRLWTFFLEQAGVTEQMRWADLPAKQQQQLIRLLVANEFIVNGKTTFKEEFVTCGGIQLNEVDVNSMQSKLLPGLYFAGEVMDVDGITGGFNFQHAWTSGWIAAQHIAQQV